MIYYVFTDEDKKKVAELDEILQENGLRSYEDFCKFSELKLVNCIKGVEHDSVGVFGMMLRNMTDLTAGMQEHDARITMLENELLRTKRALAQIVSTIDQTSSSLNFLTSQLNSNYDIQQIKYDTGST